MKARIATRIILAAALAAAPVLVSAHGQRATAEMNVSVMVVPSSSATTGTRANGRSVAFSNDVKTAGSRAVQYSFRDSRGERTLGSAADVGDAVAKAQRSGDRDVLVTVDF